MGGKNAENTKYYQICEKRAAACRILRDKKGWLKRSKGRLKRSKGRLERSKGCLEAFTGCFWGMCEPDFGAREAFSGSWSLGSDVFLGGGGL